MIDAFPDSRRVIWCNYSAWRRRRAAAYRRAATPVKTTCALPAFDGIFSPYAKNSTFLYSYCLLDGN